MLSENKGVNKSLSDDGSLIVSSYSISVLAIKRKIYTRFSNSYRYI